MSPVMPGWRWANREKMTTCLSGYWSERSSDVLLSLCLIQSLDPMGICVISAKLRSWARSRVLNFFNNPGRSISWAFGTSKPANLKLIISARFSSQQRKLSFQIFSHLSCRIYGSVWIIHSPSIDTNKV